PNFVRLSSSLLIKPLVTEEALHEELLRFVAVCGADIRFRGAKRFGWTTEIDAERPSGRAAVCVAVHPERICDADAKRLIFPGPDHARRRRRRGIG
ncbi:MAG: hypothetical protein ABSC22_20115, partial [Roseiarcus sp.]